jgi:hypothetical protein
VFYFATAPISDPRHGGNGLWIVLLAITAIGIPAVGFWRNNAFFREVPPHARTRASTLLVAETAAFLAALMVFANLTAGGEEETSIREKVSQLIITGAEAQRLVEAKISEGHSISRVGTKVTLQTSGNISEALLGSDGAVILYDDQLRALATMLPSAREEIVDWRVEGFPMLAFPEHWHTRNSTSLIVKTPGTPIEHSQQMLDPATRLQQEISAEAKKRGSLQNLAPARLLPPEGLVDFGYVDPDGWFALYSDRHGVFVVFEPELKGDGLVHWQCRVHPAEAAIPGCASGRR